MESIVEEGFRNNPTPSRNSLVWLGMSSAPNSQYSRLDSSNMPSNEDDWHGITNPVERRKRQNRLRQRAWRARKQTSQTSSTHGESLYQEDCDMLVGVDLYSYTSVTHDSSITGTLQNLEVKVLTRETQRPEVNGWVQSETHRLIPPLLQYSAFTGAIQPPRPIVFPLSADHCLITLVQYNFVRALLQNMSLLSLLHHLPPGCRSSFGVSEIDTIAVKHIPSDLQTTSLQRTRTPPFWINALPFPKLRDNLILMADRYDSRELLLDLGLRVYEGFNDIERCGFLVWGHPWLATSWEVSEGFVRRWGFLLKGCPEVVDSADRWRLLRGEERLVVNV